MVSSDFKLHHYFDSVYHISKNKSFIVVTEKVYTYKDVFNLTQSYIQLLSDYGIKKGDRVVLHASKNAESIALFLACSNLNCIYVPISSLNPASRAKQIINDTSASFVVCDYATKGFIEEFKEKYSFIPNQSDLFFFKSTTPSVSELSDNSDAFILFTSGSTGSAKGVVISHKAAAVFVNWSVEEFNLGDSEVFSSIAPFNFDLSVFDIYAAMKCGGILRLYNEEETKNALLMAKYLSEDNITTVYGTPTFFNALSDFGKLHKYNYKSIKNVLFAGEVFHIDKLKNLIGYWPDAKYFNLYGPTETNVCTFYPVDKDKDLNENLSIGKNCPYTHLIVLDETDNLIEECNKVGELCVSGESLFNRYWNDASRTNSASFMVNYKIRYYRTGDMVKFNQDGNFYYISRKDRMIKKYGFRIEPGEIESVLISRFPVRNAIVYFSNDNNKLNCFVEGDESADLNMNKLSGFCRKHLPVYMIPDKFVILSKFPETSSGKLDFQKLKMLIE